MENITFSATPSYIDVFWASQAQNCTAHPTRTPGRFDKATCAHCFEITGLPFFVEGTMFSQPKNQNMMKMIFLRKGRLRRSSVRRKRNCVRRWKILREGWRMKTKAASVVWRQRSSTWRRIFRNPPVPLWTSVKNWSLRDLKNKVPRRRRGTKIMQESGVEVTKTRRCRPSRKNDWLFLWHNNPRTNSQYTIKRSSKPASQKKGRDFTEDSVDFDWILMWWRLGVTVDRADCTPNVSRIICCLVVQETTSCRTSCATMLLCSSHCTDNTFNMTI